MSLENSNTVDALGIEKETGSAVLTIADAWDWEDERKHLIALQAKLNAYLNFIESGQLVESLPSSESLVVVIDVLFKYPIAKSGIDLLNRAAAVSTDLRVQIRYRHEPG